MFENLLARFITYAKINTRSNPESNTIPSSPNQTAFLKELAKELDSLGLSDVYLNPADSYLTATLPGNREDADDLPTIGFIAHVDTADFSAENVQPQVHQNYDGGDIQLNDTMILSPKEFPQLKNYLGQTLVTTDGTTLLGADDKAGIAEIVTAMEYLLAHPELKHGHLKVAFGPDEEIGQGAKHFDVERFDCDFAYTMDGGPVGELQFETFNAAEAKLKFFGTNVHPGTAKDTMVNALQLAVDYHQSLPVDLRPEKTAGRQGFYHLVDMKGNVEQADLAYIIRDHDKEKFENMKAQMQDLIDQLNDDYASHRAEIIINDQYYNMGEVFENDTYPLDLALSAFNELGIKVDQSPVRGGTDGSLLSFRGLPCPNIFAGGENMHGPYEFVALESMEKASQVIIKIAELTDLN